MGESLVFRREGKGESKTYENVYRTEKVRAVDWHIS